MTRILKLLAAHRLGHLAPYVQANIKRSIRIWDAGKGEVARTRLGGRPNLPPEIDWPRWQGQPLAFLAQIDLSGLPMIQGFDVPREGSLFFFHMGGENAPWGYKPTDRGTAQVLYSPKSLTASRRCELPDDLEENRRYRAVKLGIEAVEDTIPELSDPIIDELSLSFDQQVAYDEVWDQWNKRVPDRRHRMAGYPDPLQGGIRLQAQMASHGLERRSPNYTTREKTLRPGAKDWELLLQIDSDDDAGMMWGDSGRIYFLIHKDDLAARRFENVWAILECM